MRHFLVSLILLVALTNCRNNNDPTTPTSPPAVATQASDVTIPTAVATNPPVVPATATPIPPTPTPQVPLAALVNGQPVFLADYQVAVEQSVQGLTPEEIPADNGAVVLDMLISRALFEQAATELGIVVTPEMVEAKLVELRQLAETSGGAGNFEAWLEANRFTEPQLREFLYHDLIREQLLAMVTANVPYEVKQVHARYLQVDDLALAQSLLEQARNGADFAELAREHSLDRVTGEDGGDLDFFPAGQLLIPEIETAAFALQPGQTSDIITLTNSENETTYLLVHVVEIDEQRPVTGRVRSQWLQERFETWIAELWANAEIQLFDLTPDT